MHGQQNIKKIPAQIWSAAIQVLMKPVGESAVLTLEFSALNKKQVRV